MVYTPIAVVFRSAGIHFLGVGMEGRIGHLLAEPYYAACLRAVEPKKYKRFILLYNPSEVVNTAVLAGLPDSFTWIKGSVLRWLMHPLQRHPISALDLNRAVRTATGSAHIYNVINDYQGRPNFLRLPASLPSGPAQILANLGVSNRNWYVVVHNREQGTFGQTDNLHDYRNGSITSFLPAIKLILAEGGAVIRIGDPSMTRLPPLEGLIDFALGQSTWGEQDLNICRHAKFFLGSTSGALLMSAVQGVPVVGVNAAPFGASKIWDIKSISVPKIYVNTYSNEPIPFKEIFTGDLADVRSSAVFEKFDIRLIDTPPDEILGAVEQVLDIGTYGVESELDRQLEKKFASLFHEGNYSYWSKSRIARVFLRNYEYLL